MIEQLDFNTLTGDTIYEVCCDECGSSEDFEADHWNSMIQGIKNDGWSIKLVDKSWNHKCPKCTQPLPASEDFEDDLI